MIEPPSDNTLLVEYQAGNDAVHHYDDFKWSSGSFLTAGVFFFWSALFTAPGTSPRLLAAGSLLVAAVMTTWLLYVHHYREIYLFKLDRLLEIEEHLGMQNHRRFNVLGPGALGPGALSPGGRRSRAWRGSVEEALYAPKAPSGHAIDLALYFIVAASGPVLSAVVLWKWSGYQAIWEIGTLVCVTATVWRVRCVDSSVKSRLKRRQARLSPLSRAEQEWPWAPAHLASPGPENEAPLSE